MPPGTVRISPERQQLIGIQIGQVEEASYSYVIRTIGRIAADEARIYRINTATEGWIRDTYPNTTGSFVMKDDLLTTFYTINFLTAQQSYIFALEAQQRFLEEEPESVAQHEVSSAQVREAAENLQNLGVGERQLEELAQSRKLAYTIQVRSPADGFVLARNVSPGQWFAPGTELYQVADLSRVWVLVDIFERDARYIHPELEARVLLTHQGRLYKAMVSDVLPQFDPGTRVLKARLEVDNPGYVLRPDMFVDVEIPVSLPPAISVPVDAVMDSGVRKTVFVDRGNGFFEPRKVETGWRLGDRVEIVEGLMPGERIVISGNFLIDSESRMKLAAAGISGSLSKDPVCGMEVGEAAAMSAGWVSQYPSGTLYFCSEECKKQFDGNPEAYMRPTGKKQENRPPEQAPSKAHARSEIPAYIDPVCRMLVAPGKAKATGKAVEFEGKTYSFCSERCKREFEGDPRHFLNIPMDTMPTKPASMEATRKGGVPAHD